MCKKGKVLLPQAEIDRIIPRETVLQSLLESDFREFKSSLVEVIAVLRARKGINS